MKKTILNGAIILMVGGIICKIIGAIYRIPLTNILSVEGMGIYGLIFPFYTLLLVLSSTSIPIAVSKIIAEKEHKNDYFYSKKVLKLSFLLLFIVGSLGSLVVFLLSDKISFFQGNIKASLGYKVISPSILVVGLLSIFRGYFQGKMNMFPTAISQIIEQIIKVIFGILFSKIFIYKGIEYGVMGASLGVTLSELIALIYISIVFILKYNRHIDYKVYKLSNLSVLKYILKTYLPIMCCGIILPLASVIDSLMIINLLKNIYPISIATSLYGLQTGVISSIINLPIAFATAFATSLIPTLSCENNSEIFNQKVYKIFKILSIIVIPSACGVIIFSKNILFILYGKSLLDCGLENVSSSLLKINSFSIIFASYSLIFTAILQSKNNLYAPVINTFIGCLFKIILNLILVPIPSINIYGEGIASVICFAITSLLNLKSMLQYRCLLIKFGDLVKILLSTFIMILSIMLIQSLLNLKYEFLLAIFVGIVIYFGNLLLIKSFSKSNLDYNMYKFNFFKKATKINKGENFKK